MEEFIIFFAYYCLKQDITKKQWMDKKNKRTEFKVSNKKKYEVKRIYHNMIYMKVLKKGHLLRLYYLVSQKSYLEKENT